MLQKLRASVFYPCFDYRIAKGFLRFQNCIYINRVPIHIIGETLFVQVDHHSTKIFHINNYLTDIQSKTLYTPKEEHPKERNQKDATEETAKMVLLLPVSAQGGSLNDFVVSVKESDCEKVVSPIRGVDFAMTVSGDSMSPEYPNGSRIFIKRINERAFIEWGKVYVLDTCNGTVIKILVPAEKEGYVKCVSINQDPIFAPFEVAFEDIYGVYKVLLCMSVK